MLLKWNKSMISKVQKIIQVVEGNDYNNTYYRFDIDTLCGQANKLSNKILRSIFIRKPQTTSTKNQEIIEHMVFQPIYDAIKAEYYSVTNGVIQGYLNTDFDKHTVKELKEISNILRGLRVTPTEQFQFDNRISHKIWLERKKSPAGMTF